MVRLKQRLLRRKLGLLDSVLEWSGVNTGEKESESSGEGTRHRQLVPWDKPRHILERAINKTQVSEGLVTEAKSVENANKGLYGKPALFQSRQICFGLNWYAGQIIQKPRDTGKTAQMYTPLLYKGRSGRFGVSTFLKYQCKARILFKNPRPYLSLLVTL